jgi:hypothetical protein
MWRHRSDSPDSIDDIHPIPGYRLYAIHSQDSGHTQRNYIQYLSFVDTAISVVSFRLLSPALLTPSMWPRAYMWLAALLSVRPATDHSG